MQLSAGLILWALSINHIFAPLFSLFRETAVNTASFEDILRWGGKTPPYENQQLVQINIYRERDLSVKARNSENSAEINAKIPADWTGWRYDRSVTTQIPAEENLLQEKGRLQPSCR